MVLYSRTEHGGFPVLKTDGGFEVGWPQGSFSYPNARQLILALVNQAPLPPPEAKDPKLTFNRYFRLGRYAKYRPLKTDTLDLFSGLALEEPPVKIPKSELIVHVPLGIDLANRGHEVAKLFYAGFGRTAARKGWDLQEVLQEVYKALLIRNQGTCPWDPAKSSFGHYVYMVCRGVMSNYGRKTARVYEAESYGTYSAAGKEIDVAESNLAVTEENTSEIDGLIHRRRLRDFVLEGSEEAGVGKALLGECFALIAEGGTQKEISEKLSISVDRVSRISKFIRTRARQY